MTAKAPNYRRTLTACYLGFITQAISANFAPLLFLRFRAEFGISLVQLALIPTVFFSPSCWWMCSVPALWI